jgi:hypothetical protein
MDHPLLTFYQLSKKYFILLLILFLFSVNYQVTKGESAIYYVDNSCSVNGNGACNGSAPVCTCASGMGQPGPFNSLTSMQSKVDGYQPGDQILLKRGEVYREQISVLNSNIVLGDYGAGNLPLIKGSDVFSGWKQIPSPAFQTNFEQNEKKNWSGVETLNGTISLSDQLSFDGKYSLKSSLLARTGYARFVKNNVIKVDQGGDMWFTARIFLPTGFSVTDYSSIAYFSENGGKYSSFYLGVTSSNLVSVVNPGMGSAQYTGVHPVPINRWFSLRMHVHVANRGSVQVWVDDSEEINRNDVDTFVTNPYAHLRVGLTGNQKDIATIFYDSIRIGASIVDPSVGKGYYKTEIHTQPNDGFVNGVRLLRSPLILSAYPMAYHLSEGTNRLGYDRPNAVVYIRLAHDADPNGQVIELAQRDQGILIYNLHDVTIRNLSVQHANDKSWGGIRIVGPGGGHQITSVDASNNANSGLSIDAGSENNRIKGGFYNNNIRYGINILSSAHNQVTGATSGGTLESVNGALIAKLSDHTVFDGNTVSETRGYGLDCYDSDQVVMRNNTTIGAENGIWVEGSCPGYLIENNHVTGSKGAGIQVANTVAGVSPNGIIQRNFLSDNQSGIVLSTHLADNTTVRYNLITSTKTSTTDGDIKIFLADNVKILNNTLVNGGGNGISFYSSGSDVPDNCLVENNSVYKPNGFALLVGFNMVKKGTGNIFDHNSYYKPVGNLVSWKAQDFGVGQFAQYQQTSQQDAHSLITDPLFLSISDYHLQPFSPLINVGVDLGLNFDFSGIILPQGNSNDIGAFEYVPSTAIK